MQLTLVNGATPSMVRVTFAKFRQARSQLARQADGVTTMDVIGKIHSSLTRGQRKFELYALVIRQLDEDILVGNPFMVRNDIGVRPAKRQTAIGDNYNSPSRHTRQPIVRRKQSFLLRNPFRKVRGHYRSKFSLWITCCSRL